MNAYSQITPAQRDTLPSIVRAIGAMPLHEQLQLMLDVSEGRDFNQCDYQATQQLEAALNRLKADAVYDLREESERLHVGASRTGMWM